jgi:hypothetical protein
VGSCDCPSFRSNGRCKHVGGFARKIAEDYDILDDLSLKLSPARLPSESVSETTGGQGKLSDRYMVNPKLLANLPKNLDAGMIEYFLKHHPEYLVKKSSVTPLPSASPLDIFSGLSAPPAPKNPDAEHLRIKVEILRGVSLEKNDLFLSLYQGKIQKSGHLSVGKKLFRGDIYDAKYQKFTPFLEEKNNGESRWGSSARNPRMSFKRAPEFFMQLLTQATEPVSDLENAPLVVKKEPGRLRIGVEKNTKDGVSSYTVSLFLQNGPSQAGTAPLKKQTLFHASGTGWFAYLENQATI